MTEISLTQYGLMAERHWRQYRPKMVKRLETQGTLEGALFEAQEKTIEEMDTLRRRLQTERSLTSQQAQTQAWELIREKYILLEPEPGVAL